MIYGLLFLFFEIYLASDNLYKIRLFTQSSGSNILILKCFIDGKSYPMEIDLNANKTEIISNEVLEKKVNFTIETIQNRIEATQFPLKSLRKFRRTKIGHFSLSKSIDPSYSLIHYLYNHHLITKRIFMIENYVSHDAGLLYIGDYVSQELFNNALFSYVPTTTSSQWSVMLNYIFLGNIYDNYQYDENSNRFHLDFHLSNYYTVNQPVFFCYNDDMSYVPLKFFNFLIDTYFKDFMAKDICKTIIYDDDIEGIICKREIKSKATKINFIIKDFSLRMSHLLFDVNNINDDSEYTFKFIFAAKKEEDVFIFGSTFLGEFIISFDYDNNQIGFFSSTSKDLIIINSNSKNNCVIYLLMCNVLLLLYSIINSLYIKHIRS